MEPQEPVVVVMGQPGEGPRVAGPADPVVTADDLGLVRGDGCFDSLRVVTDEDGSSTPVRLEEHLARLARSAQVMEIPTPGVSAWTGLVETALERWSTPGEAVCKLVLTRGREGTGAATAFLTLTHRGPLRAPGEATDAGHPGLRVVTLSSGRPSDAFDGAPWLLGGVKTLSYVVNVAATREARRRGADDAIFVTTDGYALDGPTAGLLVAGDGALLTPPAGGTGILESVTISELFERARGEGVECRHALVRAADLAAADGVWLVSSGRGPAPVVELDGQALRTDPALLAQVARLAGF